MSMVEKISLFFIGGSSDKFYNICIMEEDDGTFNVPFTYGRRGTSGQSGTKTTTPTTYEQAKKAYNKVVKEKTAKGYKVGTGPGSGTSGVVNLATVHSGITVEKVDSGILPQLLCPIPDDEVEMYLKDPRYGAQEKKDGRRKFMQRKETGQNVSINRKGQEVGYPACFEDACEFIIKNNMIDRFILDGEEVGEKLYVFDSLQIGNKSIKGLPYKERYSLLQQMVMEKTFELLPLAETEAEKRALYEELKKKEKEGIIFKLLEAVYEEGRPSEDIVSYSQRCPQVKNKFYATASCIVIRHNQKRSIGLGVYDGTELIDHGNCTIPPNKEVPEINSIVEIRMLYCFKGGKIYQPTYLGPRDDIDAKECVVSKLKYKPE